MCALRREPPPRDSQPSLYKLPLGRAKLWLNDLDDLVRLLKSRGNQIRIMAGDAIADSVDDLPDATAKELRQVLIVAADPLIVVRLSAIRPEVFSPEPTDEAQVLVDDVAALLRARRTLLPSLHLTRMAVVVSLVASALLAYGGVLISEGQERDPSYIPPHIAVPLVILGCVASGVLTIHGLTLFYGSITIVPERRRDHRLLSRSARREWTVATISVLVSALIATALTYWQVKAK